MPGPDAGRFPIRGGGPQFDHDSTFSTRCAFRREQRDGLAHEAAEMCAFQGV